MVCQRMQVAHENAIYIYLREVNLGLSERVVLWLDDQVFLNSWQRWQI